MKQIKILLAGFAAMAISFVSCTNDFESANANPNELNEINPEYLFNTSSYYTLNAFCGSMKKVLLANYSHYYGGATGGQVQRYGNQGSTNDSYWKIIFSHKQFLFGEVFLKVRHLMPARECLTIRNRIFIMLC